MKPPKLIPIDLKRCCEMKGGYLGGGIYQDHPDITVRKQYLIKYNGDFYAGKFKRVWYGWSFCGVYDAGVQLDKPGTNGSNWQAIWEIKSGK